MPKVKLLSRELAAGFPGERPEEHLVAVTYSGETVPPRTVQLAQDLYRPATADELTANPRLKLYPKDQAAVDAELQALRRDFDQVISSAPPTLELP